MGHILTIIKWLLIAASVMAGLALLSALRKGVSDGIEEKNHKDSDSETPSPGE